MRLQSKDFVGKYTGTLDCFGKVVREEGMLALYSGVQAHCYRNCIFNCTFFAGCVRITLTPSVTPILTPTGRCHVIRDAAMENSHHLLPSGAGRDFCIDFVAGPSRTLTPTRVLLTPGMRQSLTSLNRPAGTIMGVVATPAKMPFFVVKTRLQVLGGNPRESSP